VAGAGWLAGPAGAPAQPARPHPISQPAHPISSPYSRSKLLLLLVQVAGSSGRSFKRLVHQPFGWADQPSQSSSTEQGAGSGARAGNGFHLFEENKCVNSRKINVRSKKIVNKMENFLAKALFWLPSNEDT